jgi:hypothetical protein
MPKRTMRKYLRKPKPGKSKVQVKWERLYRKALERAEAENDPRVQDLRHFSNNPEAALRRLSIVSEVDLEREFPS